MSHSTPSIGHAASSARARAAQAPQPTIKLSGGQSGFAALLNTARAQSSPSMQLAAHHANGPHGAQRAAARAPQPAQARAKMKLNSAHRTRPVNAVIKMNTMRYGPS